MGQTDYHRGATVPPGKQHPFCDRYNLQLLVTQAGAGCSGSAVCSGLLFWGTTDDDFNFVLDSEKKKEKRKAFEPGHLSYWGDAKRLPDGFCLTSPWWLALKENASSLSSWFSEAGFSFLQKECAKLGAAIITAHLRASWTEIVHFPSESICRPIIRIILGTPGYPVVTASSESISRSRRSCSGPKQLRPQSNVNTKLILCYILLSITTGLTIESVNRRQETVVNIWGIVGRWLWTCAPCLLLTNAVVCPSVCLTANVWTRQSSENKTCCSATTCYGMITFQIHRGVSSLHHIPTLVI